MGILNKAAVSVAVAFALSSAAQAVEICPTGNCGAGQLSVDVLDWTVGNANVTPVTPSTPNRPVVVGDTFQTYAHARLSSFNDSKGNPVGGLFGVQEWTYVLGFLEEVSAVSGTPTVGSATFETITGGINFFRIYYSGTAADQSSNLTGLGFGPGTLVLEASINAFDINDPNKLGQTSFNANTPLDQAGNPIFANLDQFVNNDYPNIQTITGQGGGRLGMTLVSYNSAFFPNGLPADITLDFDTQVNLAYDKTDPSACFWNGSAYVNGAGGQGTTCLNSIGSINGFNGVNLMLMSDSSTNLQGVPEPGTLALVGLGLAALGMARRRRTA